VHYDCRILVPQRLPHLNPVTRICMQIRLIVCVFNTFLLYKDTSASLCKVTRPRRSHIQQISACEKCFLLQEACLFPVSLQRTYVTYRVVPWKRIYTYRREETIVLQISCCTNTKKQRETCISLELRSVYITQEHKYCTVVLIQSPRRSLSYITGP
jgi:hypothetical protein